MLIITKENNSIKVVGQNNPTYPYSGTLVYPLNSVTVVTDQSNMAVFRSALNNDVLFTGLINDITINGSPVTKEDIGNKFGAISTSGGGTSYTAGEGIDISEANVISVDSSALNIPTRQTGQEGTTNNYIYSNPYKDEYRAVSAVSIETINKKLMVRGRFWGQPTYSSINLSNYAVPEASSDSNGLLSIADKTKLDSIDVASILSRITSLETQMGAVSAKLDSINGEAV